MRARRGLRMVGLVALAFTMVALAWVDPGALCALPALVLALLLALRRYPGERTLAALARLGDERRRRPAASVPCRTLIGVMMPRGGLLLACALAVRPPPRVSRATA